MKNTILSFSLNGKNMFLRRMDMFGSPVITSIKKWQGNSIKENYQA